MKSVTAIAVCLAWILLFSCRTSHLIETKISRTIDSTTLGVLVQYNESEDTSSIAATLKESLAGCKVPVLEGFFKKEIYQKENFNLLFDMNKEFISAQPGLKNLQQLLVVKIVLVKKVDDGTNKNVVGMVFLGRWMSLSPVQELHDFYYVEKMNSTGSDQDWTMLTSFLASQLHVKLCYDIEKYIKN
jgi:hypothetical protein